MVVIVYLYYVYVVSSLGPGLLHGLLANGSPQKMTKFAVFFLKLNWLTYAEKSCLLFLYPFDTLLDTLRLLETFCVQYIITRTEKFCWHYMMYKKKLLLWLTKAHIKKIEDLTMFLTPQMVWTFWSELFYLVNFNTTQGSKDRKGVNCVTVFIVNTGQEKKLKSTCPVG